MPEKWYQEAYYQTKDGTKLAYVDNQQKQQPVIVFFHGWTSQGDAFASLAAKLKESYRIIWFDYRGHGKTHSNGPFTLEQLAQDAFDLLNYLQVNHMIFVGYSMGAHVIFEYLRRFGFASIQKVVILDMTPKLLNDEEWKHGLYQGHYTQKEYEMDLHRIANKPNHFFAIFFQEVLFKKTKEQPRNFRPRLFFKLLAKFTTKGAKTEFWSEMVEQDYRDLLPQLPMPIAVVYADPGSIYEEGAAVNMTTMAPFGKLYPVSKATHITLIDRVDEIVQAIIDE